MKNMVLLEIKFVSLHDGGSNILLFNLSDKNDVHLFFRYYKNRLTLSYNTNIKKLLSCAHEDKEHIYALENCPLEIRDRVSNYYCILYVFYNYFKILLPKISYAACYSKGYYYSPFPLKHIEPFTSKVYSNDEYDNYYTTKFPPYINSIHPDCTLLIDKTNDHVSEKQHDVIIYITEDSRKEIQDIIHSR